MTKILYRGYEKVPGRRVGYCDVFIHSLACYLNAKERGYDNVYIVFPRFNSYGYDIGEAAYYQETKVLPWKYIRREKDIDITPFDEIVDTSKRNSLYKGYPGLLATGLYFDIYPDIYYYRTGDYPYLDIKKTSKKKYILFQYRENNSGPKRSMRDSNPTELRYYLDIFRSILGDEYKYIKTGEKSPIDNEFDEVLPMMYDNLDKLVETINNATFAITAHSGPGNVAYYLKGLPTIRYGNVPMADTMFPGSRIREINSTVRKLYNIYRHPIWNNEFLWYEELGLKPDNFIHLFVNKGNIIDRQLLEKFIRDNLK